MFKLASETDIDKIVKLANITRDHMQANGLEQWVGDYPNKTHFLNDYNNKGLFIYTVNNDVLASISLLPENDEAYKAIKWTTNNALVIHRIIVNPKFQKQGLGKLLFNEAIRYAKQNYYPGIKVDTHPNNLKMQGLIIKMGFNYLGYLESINRLAYELVF